MQPLNTEQLLSVWEQSSHLSSARKAMMLLQTACPDRPVDALAAASVGERDRMLLRLRRWAFGEEIGCRPSCPQCGTELESKFQAGDLMDQEIQAGDFEVADNHWRVQCRLINSSDLLALEAAASVDAARTMLMNRAITSALHNGQPIQLAELPPEILLRVASAMEARDPLANVELAFTCPSCATAWNQVFDILSFFWSEIDAWAIRMLRRVDTLARVYGWSERDILNLSPARAQLYLQMAGG